MTATLEAPEVTEAPERLTFDANAFARGWLSVALAAGDDEARPALYQAVHLEFFPEGVRLIATDSYMLFRAWIPKGLSDDAEPGLDETPEITATACDAYKRGQGLMRHLVAITSGKDAPPCDVKLSIGTDPRADAEPSFDGLERQYAILDVPEQEVLTLPLYEGVWADWRAVVGTFTPESTTEVAFAPELIVSRLGKLGKLHSGCPLLWRFGGREKPAQIELMGASPTLTGLVMPTKVYLPDLAPEGVDPVENVAAAVVELVNEGALGEGWTAEMTPAGAGVNVTIDTDEDLERRLRDAVGEDPDDDE